MLLRVFDIYTIMEIRGLPQALTAQQGLPSVFSLVFQNNATFSSINAILVWCRIRQLGGHVSNNSMRTLRPWSILTSLRPFELNEWIHPSDCVSRRLSLSSLCVRSSAFFTFGRYGVGSSPTWTHTISRECFLCYFVFANFDCKANSFPYSYTKRLLSGLISHAFKTSDTSLFIFMTVHISANFYVFKFDFPNSLCYNFPCIRVVLKVFGERFKDIYNLN